MRVRAVGEREGRQAVIRERYVETYDQPIEGGRPAETTIRVGEGAVVIEQRHAHRLTSDAVLVDIDRVIDAVESAYVADSRGLLSRVVAALARVAGDRP